MPQGQWWVQRHRDEPSANAAKERRHEVPRTMQNEPDPIATSNPKTLHPPSQPVCFRDELPVRQLYDRTIVPVPMRITLRAPELFQKL